MTRHARSFLRGIGVLAASTTYLAYVFQWPLRPFTAFGIGDWLDPYFINGILEHWYWSLTHFSDPASPTMYFPARGTLGYSHALTLYAPFYVLVRPFLHPFQADVLTLFLMIQVGVVSLYLIFRRHMRLGFIEAVALTMFFLTSVNLINYGAGNWSQRLSVFLFPPVGLLTLAAFRARRWQGAIAWLAGFLSMLLFTQDFYPAVFAVLLAGLFLTGLLPLTRAWRDLIGDLVRRGWLSWREAWHAAADGRQPRPGRWWWIGAVGLLAWSLIVWLFPIEPMQLGPVQVSARHPERPAQVAAVLGAWWIFRSWSVTRYLEQLIRRPQWIGRMAAAAGGSDLLRQWNTHGRLAWPLVLGVVTGAAVFVWIYVRSYLEHPAFPVDQLILSLIPVEPRSWRGITDFRKVFDPYFSLRPFDAAFVAVGLAWLPFFRVDSKTRFFALWCAAVSALVLVIPLSVGAFSLWTLIFKYLPGLSVIRDPKRLVEMFELAVVVLLALLLARQPARSALRFSIITVVCALMFWNWNRDVFHFERENRLFDRWVEAPVTVDSRCRSFFIKGASETYMSERPGHMWSLYGVDAWFISMRYGIPTLNGYSAWAPETWRLANPQESGYKTSVDEWIDGHHLTNVCVLDIDARTMTPYVR